MKTLVTPTLKVADNEKTKAILWELAAQRITGLIQPTYESDDMIRGGFEEGYARDVYHENIAPVEEVGFITENKWGFTIGFSPDGLVGDDKFIEIKSRRQRFQVEEIVTDEMPNDYLMQIQTGFLVSGRSECDFISYCGGMPLFVKPVQPRSDVQDAILTATEKAEAKIAEIIERYMNNAKRFIPTERIVEQEITV